LLALLGAHPILHVSRIRVKGTGKTFLFSQQTQFISNKPAFPLCVKGLLVKVKKKKKMQNALTVFFQVVFSARMITILFTHELAHKEKSHWF
jgi:hypothetical protein